jgi:hypothetical protein
MNVWPGRLVTSALLGASEPENWWDAGALGHPGLLLRARNLDASSMGSSPAHGFLMRCAGFPAIAGRTVSQME